MKTAVLLPLLLLGCATDMEDPTLDQLDQDDLIAADDEAVTPSTIAYCLAPPTPPPADDSWTLASVTMIGLISDYGTGACDAHVQAIRNVESVTATAAATPTTPEACVGTELTMRKYRKDGSTWTFVESESATGVWTFEGCRRPKISWHANTSSDVRVHIKTSRTTCSGIYCATVHGLSMTLAASPYIPDVPN